MLKYKITNRHLSSDVVPLNLLNHSRVNVPQYVVDDSGDIEEVLSNKVEVSLKFEDVYDIKDNSHLIYHTIINGYSKSELPYTTELPVSHVSKANNSLIVSADRFIGLPLNSVSIETKYYTFSFTDNSWGKNLLTWFEINELIDSGNAIKLDVDQVGCGENLITDNKGEFVGSVNLIYYSNSNWEQVDLPKKEFETLLKPNDNSKIVGYDTFNETNEGRLVNLDKTKTYYTKEDYITIKFAIPHYHSGYHIEVDDNGNKDFVAPLIYFNIEKYDSELGQLKTIRYRVKTYVYSHDTVLFSLSSDNISVYTDVKKHIPANKEEIEDLVLKLFPYGYKINPLDNSILEQNGYTGNVEAYRDSFVFGREYHDFQLYFDKSINIVKIPISQKFETDLNHLDLLKIKFVDAEKERLINPIADMEKIVYLPAIQTKVGNQINAKYETCKKIVFNLHFREHRDILVNGKKNEWVCENDCYWNGVKRLRTEYTVNGKKSNKTILDLMGRVYRYNMSNANSTKIGKKDYFSYYKNTPIEPINVNDGGFDSDSDYKIAKDNYSSYVGFRKIRNNLFEYQSDLLSFLGFTNDDVKFQKSKLKKSFLRVSFFDSDNTANQNLLHSSTIFLNSGELFSKYIRNVTSDEEYVVLENFPVLVINNKGEWVTPSPSKSFKKNDIISAAEYNRLNNDQKKLCKPYGNTFTITGGSSNNSNYTVIYDKIGLRSNCEPMVDIGIDTSKDMDKQMLSIENLRLSSQFSVSDKFSSKVSSEGFYLYTYKNADSGVFPKDLYMRVEFNHAGYGRTIPFMMPYISETEENLIEGESGYERYTKSKRDSKIKTFDDICFDWSEVDFDKGIYGGDDGNKFIKPEHSVGYNARKYLKYCYIKWKYRYDKNTKQHIYYLDPDFYGTGVTSENNHGDTIILNLYEGKVN